MAAGDQVRHRGRGFRLRRQPDARADRRHDRASACHLREVGAECHRRSAGRALLGRRVPRHRCAHRLLHRARSAAGGADGPCVCIRAVPDDIPAAAEEHRAERFFERHGVRGRRRRQLEARHALRRASAEHRSRHAAPRLWSQARGRAGGHRRRSPGHGRRARGGARAGTRTEDRRRMARAGGADKFGAALRFEPAAGDLSRVDAAAGRSGCGRRTPRLLRVAWPRAPAHSVRILAGEAVPEPDRETGADRGASGRAGRSTAAPMTQAVWLVLPDPFSSRLFFDTGIVDRLQSRVDDGLSLVLDEGERAWAERSPGLRVVARRDLIPDESTLVARVDRRLDSVAGFYPLSLRQSLRYGFNRARMQAGHSNWFLDPDRAGPLPRSAALDRALREWHYGRLRHVAPRLLDAVARERPVVALGNTQMHSVVPFVLAARRVGLPVVGHIASWDHTVGKGIVPPGLARYVVQNEVMRDDLVRYHDVDAARIAVTGWPQTDVFHRARARSEYERVLRGLGLEPARPTVLVMGNTPTNAPYEKNFVDRLVAWWEESGAAARFSLLFRPHPRDREWRQRFSAALPREGVGVQEPSFTDIETLAVLLQHGDAVVSNAGTIL